METKIVVWDGPYAQVIVETLPDGWHDDQVGVRLAIDFRPQEQDKRGDYKAVYMTRKEARQTAIAILQCAEIEPQEALEEMRQAESELNV